MSGDRCERQLDYNPIDFEAPEVSSLIEAESSLTVPRPEDESAFAVSGSGFVQLITLVSTEPLRNVLRGLEDMARSRGVSRGFLQLQENEPLRVLGDLIGDVGNISRSNDPATIGVVDTSQQSPIDTNVLAAFSTMIEIREEAE